MIEQHFDRASGVARITLAAPERANALGPDDIRALAEAVKLGFDEGVRCLVLEAKGPVFSAGAALDALADVTPEALLTSAANDFAALARVFEDLPVPSLCALNGPAVGGGAGIALLPDVIVASDKASLAFPFAKLGLVPDSGLTHRLTRSLGLARARHLFLTGGALSAAQAFEAGLVSQTAPADSFEAAVAAMIDRLRLCAPGLAGSLRRLTNAATMSTLFEQITREAEEQATRLMLSSTQASLAAALSALRNKR